MPEFRSTQHLGIEAVILTKYFGTWATAVAQSLSSQLLMI